MIVKDRQKFSILVELGQNPNPIPHLLEIVTIHIPTIRVVS